MDRAVLIVGYPNGVSVTEVLSTTNAEAWGNTLAKGDRASSVQIIHSDLSVSVLK